MGQVRIDKWSGDRRGDGIRPDEEAFVEWVRQQPDHVVGVLTWFYWSGDDEIPPFDEPDVLLGVERRATDGRMLCQYVSVGDIIFDPPESWAALLELAEAGFDRLVEQEGAVIA